MKVKVLSRNPDDYLRETKHDIHRSNIAFVFFMFDIIYLLGIDFYIHT